MIKRHIEAELHKLLKEYPVVMLLGPRQAEKTTLARNALNSYEYCNLEHPEVRQFAIDDPKAFLAQFKSNIILDEIQRVPALLSYIQVIVDEKQCNGQYVLTGSHQLSSSTYNTNMLKGLKKIRKLSPRITQSYLIYSGMPLTFSENTRALKYDQVALMFR